MLFLLTLLAHPVAAQTENGEIPGINAQNFRPSIDASRTLWVDDTEVPDQPFMARTLFHYAANPLVFQYEDGERLYLVSDVLQADVAAAARFGQTRLGVDLPLYLQQVGLAGEGAGLGDVRLDAKYMFLDRVSAPLGLALDGRILMSTATVENALGASKNGWEIYAIADKAFHEDFVVAANLGLRGGPRAQLENVEVNDYLVLRLAGSYALGDRGGLALELAGEEDLATSITNRAALPLEWMISGYARTTDSITMRAGLGTGLSPGIGSPDFRIAIGLGYERKARVTDTDSDGVPDAVDGCPGATEDPDGFEDTDGCPDTDNDGDGLVDASDDCSDQAEDRDGHKDGDGCAEPEAPVTVRMLDASGQPLLSGTVAITGAHGTIEGGPSQELGLLPGHYEAVGTATGYEEAGVVFDVGEVGTIVEVRVTPRRESRVTMTEDRIQLAEKVFFDTSADTIQARSYPLLDEVASVLIQTPRILLVRIEGHTDNRGNDTANLDLSQRRAESVRNYLIQAGVSEDRLMAKGYGETRPLDPADNEAAWEKNRRVDLIVEKWGER